MINAHSQAMDGSNIPSIQLLINMAATIIPVSSQ